MPKTRVRFCGSDSRSHKDTKKFGRFNTASPYYRNWGAPLKFQGYWYVKRIQPANIDIFYQMLRILTGNSCINTRATCGCCCSMRSARAVIELDDSLAVTPKLSLTIGWFSVIFFK